MKMVLFFIGLPFVWLLNSFVKCLSGTVLTFGLLHSGMKMTEEQQAKSIQIQRTQPAKEKPQMHYSALMAFVLKKQLELQAQRTPRKEQEMRKTVKLLKYVNWLLTC